MNWDAISAIGEVVGAIAVVVSIAYLSIQIRSNTRAMKATASFDATHSWATFNENMVNWSDGEYEIFLRSFDPSADPAEFSPLEKARLGIQCRALFQKLEGQYFLFRGGFLEPGVWTARQSWARSLIELPYFAEWWRIELEQSIYSAEFVEKVLGAPSIKVDVSAAGVAKSQPAAVDTSSI